MHRRKAGNESRIPVGKCGAVGGNRSRLEKCGVGESRRHGVGGGGGSMLLGFQLHHQLYQVESHRQEELEQTRHHHQQQEQPPRRGLTPAPARPQRPTAFSQPLCRSPPPPPPPPPPLSRLPVDASLLGKRVCLSGCKVGTLRFYGQTELGGGDWCGIELDRAEGLNDGSVRGVRYFRCPAEHGVLAPSNKVSRLAEEEEALESGGGSRLSTPQSRLQGGMQSKQSSLELDESLGILTPDQMTDFAINRTPSPLDDLSMLQDIDLSDLVKRHSLEVEEVKREEESSGEKSGPTTNSFTTSVTSLDNGYQGDGELSRPSSRQGGGGGGVGKGGVGVVVGGGSRPGSRQGVKQPGHQPPPRIDPMTDSDFFTESEADIFEELIVHRRAQVIDGTLYATLPPYSIQQYSPTRGGSPDMDSSGVYSDLEKKEVRSGEELSGDLDVGGLPEERDEERECPDQEEEGLVSPGEDTGSTTGTVEKKLSPSVYSELILDQVETIKSLLVMEVDPSPLPPPPPPTPPPPPSVTPSSVKKHKMPKRNVASKIKTIVPNNNGTGRREDEENRVPRKEKGAKKGRWDEVMSKIAQGKEAEMSREDRLRCVKSRVYQGLKSGPPPSSPPSSGHLPPPSAHHGQAHRKSALSQAQSTSSRSLNHMSSLKAKSRRCRLRGSEQCLEGDSQGSSRNSSVSDLSQATRASPSSTRSSGKKRDSGGRCGGSPAASNRNHNSSTPHISPLSHSPTGKNVVGGEKVGGVVGLQGRKPAPRRANLTSSKPTPLRDQNGGVGCGKKEEVNVGVGGKGRRGGPMAAPLEALGPLLPPVSRPPAPLPLAAPRPQPNKQLAHAAKGVDALAALVNYLVFTLDAFSAPKLKTDLEKMRADWIKTKLELEETQATFSRIQDSLSSEKLAHEKALNEVIENYKSEETNLLTLHQNELENLTTKYNEEIAQARRQFVEQETSLKACFAKELASVRKGYEVEMIEMREAGEREAGRLGEAKAVAQARLAEALASRVDLDRRLADLEAENAQLRHKIQFYFDTLSSNKETKVTLQRVRELESEVSSLRCVLEMRSCELGDLRRTTQLWQSQADQLPQLEHRLATTKARLEDLQAQLQHKEAVEQELTKENRLLTDSMSEEVKARKRLSMHNEELQWKLKQNQEVANALLALYGEANTPLANAVRMQRSPKSVKRLSFNSNLARMAETDINGTRSGGEGVKSAPGSPKVKGVVEKSDSVAWILEMEEPAEWIASRLARRVLRGGGGRSRWGEEGGVREELVSSVGELELLELEEGRELQIEAAPPGETPPTPPPTTLPPLDAGGEAMVDMALLSSPFHPPAPAPPTPMDLSWSEEPSDG